MTVQSMAFLGYQQINSLSTLAIAEARITSGTISDAIVDLAAIVATRLDVLYDIAMLDSDIEKGKG